MENTHHIQDKSQNFWVLASIQSAALGIPGIIIGGAISAKYGAGSAILSLIIGNLILWLIALAMVSIATERKDAIENAKQYLGKRGMYVASWILIGAFLGWYIIQINAMTTAMGGFARIHEGWEHYKGWLGSVFGVLIAVLAIRGIELIKRICVMSLPFLFLYMLYGCFISDRTVVFEGTWKFSIPGVVMAITQNLAGIINLPTFFRHSRSKADTLLGLFCMTVLVTAFQIFSVVQGVHIPIEFFQQHHMYSSSFFHFIFGALFGILSLVCVNLVNIYFAAAGLKTFIPVKWYKYGYVLEGLAGAFLFHFNLPFYHVEHLLSNFISCMGIVLLVSFLVKSMIKHRVRKLDVTLNALCWIVGCGVSVIAYVMWSDSPRALLAGIYASLLSFLVVLFIEESTWATKKLL